MSLRLTLRGPIVAAGRAHMGGGADKRYYCVACFRPIDARALPVRPDLIAGMSDPDWAFTCNGPSQRRTTSRSEA